WNAGIYYSRAGAIGLDEMLAASQIDLVADRCARLGNISEYGRCWAYLHRRAAGLPVISSTSPGRRRTPGRSPSCTGRTGVAGTTADPAAPPASHAPWS